MFLLFVLKEAPEKSNDPDRARERVPFTSAVRQLLSSPAFLTIVGVNSLASVAYWRVYTWLALYFYERFRMSLTLAGFSSTFYIQVASFAGILLGGWIADYWAQFNLRGRALVQSIGLGAAGPFLFFVGTTDSRWILLPCLVLFGVGRGFFDCNLMPVVCQIVSPTLRATAYGILNFTSCVAGGAMAAAAGLLKDRIGLGGALQLSAAMLVAGALWLWSSRIPQARMRSAIEVRA